ncbi:hypothetical protein GJ697_13550 [Pseudoduganella sp. FT25W]|uniref:Uncharacterized protein n=1 Tax=Duganella alba TaxID=2666081 RepID=A0A6L5QHU8_9BURK|nr:hypothetical protein [Duganella alba]MRX08862.1 hypothetical protein [Duganella alba]MRX18844.1 hypothetical protein [Duganella alba]
MNEIVSISYLLKQQNAVDAIAERVREIVLANNKHPNDSIGKHVNFMPAPDGSSDFQATLHRRTIRFKLVHALIPDGSGQELIGQYEWYFVDGEGDQTLVGEGIQLHDSRFVLSPAGTFNEVYAGMQPSEEMAVFSVFARAAVTAIQKSLKVVQKHSNQG